MPFISLLRGFLVVAETENESEGIFESRYLVTDVLPAPEGAVIIMSFLVISH